MNGPSCRRRRWRVGLGLAAVPAIWFLITTCCPTDWARRRIERELSEATKCQATVGSVRLGPFGGVRLNRIELFKPDAPHGQVGWLRARDLRLDVGWFGVFTGKIHPEKVRVDGLILRLGRDEQGQFTLAHLLRSRPTDASRPEASDASHTEDSAFEIELERGTVIIDDVPSKTTTRLESIKAQAVVGPESIQIKEFEGHLEGGLVRLAANITRGPSPEFDLKLTGQGIRIGRELPLLDLILPFLPGIDREQAGLVETELDLSGKGKDFETLAQSLRGRGRIVFDPIRLDQSFLTSEISRLVTLPAEARVGSLRSEFLVQDTRISTSSLRLALGTREIKLSGFTTFDGQISYQLDLQDLSERLAERFPHLLSGRAIDSVGLLRVEIDGRVESPRLRLNGQPLTSAPGEENALRELSRRLKQRFLR